MTKPLSEPSIYKDVSSNTYQTKDTRQKPQAFRWWMPDCDASYADTVCTGEEPTLLNSFAQPFGNLEAFAFRLNADGRIQTKGVLDVSSASSGGVAWVMPGINPGEKDFIPPANGFFDSFSLRVSPSGTESNVVPATGTVDATTGDVIVSWGSTSGIPGYHAEMTTDLTLASGNDGQLKFDQWTNDNASIFEDGTLSGGRLTDVKLLVAGWYSVKCWIQFTTDPASGFAGIMMIHDDTDITAPSEMQGVTYPVNFHLSPAVTFSTVAYYPPVYQVQAVPNFAWADRLEFWAVHNAGVNRTITWAYLVIGYLGARG